MLSFFRNFFKSKVGIVVTLAFLGLIAIAFASSDVANTGTFGGVAGGDRVAVVGDEKIGNAELSRAATTALDNMRQQNPTLTMQAFVANDGLQQVLDQLIDRYSIGGYAEKYGLRAGDNLVNSEIIQIAAFRGPDGKFDQEAYQAALRQRGLSDALVRSDLADGLLAQQLLVPAAFGAKMPAGVAKHYAALSKERRQGGIGLLISAAYAPIKDPTDKQLQAYYDANKGDYIRPERRVLRYVTFGDDAITDRIEPTDAEIAARYERDKAKYAASERRSFTQLIVPTQQAANSIRDRVAGGGSLEAAAREAGLSAGSVGPITNSELSAQASEAVAKAVFGGESGKLTAPARSGLGWHVIRVDKIDRIPARSLASVRADIRETLLAENRRKALNDLAANIEEEIDSGTSLADLAETLKGSIETTPPLTAAGEVYGTRDEKAPEVLAPVVSTAFQMEDEGNPQLAEVVRGETFMVFEVGEITPSATAPLAEIKPELVGAWKLAEGNKAAKAAADRVIKRLGEGESLAAALRAENKPLPPPDSINLTRQELAARGQEVPPPLALFFSMAQGTTKKLEVPGDRGWFVVDLDSIEAGKVDPEDPQLASVESGLGAAAGREYAEQLRQAIREEMKVERNDAAIDAVAKQLTGES
jgi:peptidyl-prolyl cis-trans isomerase D